MWLVPTFCGLAHWLLRVMTLGHLHALPESFQVTGLKVMWRWAWEEEKSVCLQWGAGKWSTHRDWDGERREGEKQLSVLSYFLVQGVVLKRLEETSIYKHPRWASLGECLFLYWKKGGEVGARSFLQPALLPLCTYPTNVSWPLTGQSLLLYPGNKMVSKTQPLP